MRLLVEAVVFDNDGVLVDSHLDSHDAWRQLGREFGVTMDGEAFRKLAGRRAQDGLARFVAPERLADAVARLEDLEVERATPTTGIDGALELLSSLPGGQWAVATSASLRLATARWIGAGLPLPEVAVTAEDVVNGKPDPEPYLVAAQRLGVSPGNCVVFEDSASGALAASAAGATVVAVGDQAWPIEPAARVADLRQVDVRPDGDGHLAVYLPG